MDFIVESEMKKKTGLNFIEAVKARCEGKRVKCGCLELVCTEDVIKIKSTESGGERSLIPCDLTLNWEIGEEKKTLSDKILLCIPTGGGFSGNPRDYDKLLVCDVKEAIKDIFELSTKMLPSNERVKIQKGIKDIVGDKLL